MFISRSRLLMTSLYPKLSSYLLLNQPKINYRLALFRNHFTGHEYRFKPQKHRVSPPKGSRYAPPSRNEIAEDAVLCALKDKSFMNNVEWDDLKSEMIDSKDCVSEETFGVIVLNVLLFLNRLDLGHSLMEYLENCSMKPNFLIYLKYISLCSRNYKMVDQKLILGLLNKVQVQIDASPVLDMKRAEYFIQGLCATHRWRESFSYLKKLTEPKASQEIYNSLACAAIRNGDENVAWEILTKWMNGYGTVKDRVIEEFLFVALEKQKINSMSCDKFISKLFNYMQAQSIIISVSVAKLIEQYFKCHRRKWSITYTKVSRKGVCKNCEYTLKLSELESEEYKLLHNSFLHRAVMKSDLYINTTSKEFQNFLQFIEFHKPFHIVLDGLNAAYSYRGKQSRKNISQHLLNIVQILSGKSRKLLVLGKKHMQCWPKLEMIKLSQKAKLFFTDNISQDDPFAIYAALASGPHTLFLSDDLMRDHVSRLDDPKLIHLFKKWQLSHQIHIEPNESNDISFIEPVRHAIEVQGNMKDGWHIPFDDKIILDPYEELNNWLCIKRVDNE